MSTDKAKVSLFLPRPVASKLRMEAAARGVGVSRLVESLLIMLEKSDKPLLLERETTTS